MPRLPSFSTDCHITLDGEPVPARRGEPVAAALLAAGKVLVSRSAKYHRPRGAFCLVGACGTCLVRADGLPNQRACRTPCRDGLAVQTQNAVPGAKHDLLGVIDVVYARGLDHHHLMTWSQLANRTTVAVSRRLAGLGRMPDPAAVAAERAAGPIEEERWDALVVGAGPAGLAAAEALAEAGRRVLLADQEPRLGGRLRCRLDLPGEPDLDFAARAAARVTSAGGEVVLGAAVLGLWRDGGAPLAALHADGPPPRLRLVRPARIVVCTGGTPQPPALSGGDRPGVYGGRGLAAALAEHGVVPGTRAAVLGAGPEADAIAARLASGGMEIERVRDAEGARVLGRGRVKGIAVPRSGRVRCDTIAVATPPAPAAELARELGAAVTWDPELAAFALEVSPDGETGVPGLFAAGEVTGDMDGAVAAERGRRAGEAARG
jgi:sarcosine oxidase subunit alpha